MTTNEMALKYVRSLSGRLNAIYRKQITRSKERNFPPPSYTFKQLKERYINDPLYIKIHKEWVDSNYNKQLVPSIDRKDSTKYYTLNNIQMMTWAQNRMKQSTIDIHNSHDTPVAAVIADTVIEIYSSQKEAALITGALNIRSCIAGLRRTSGGYAWKSLRGISKKQFSNLKLKLPVLYSTIKFKHKEHRKKGVHNTIKNRKETRNYTI